jgi:hypothetical protein
MTTNFQGGSAKIYTFPARGRFADSNRRDVPTDVPTLDVAPHIAPVASGAGWYHDEAIREADLTRKN